MSDNTAPSPTTTPYDDIDPWVCRVCGTEYKGGRCPQCGRMSAVRRSDLPSAPPAPAPGELEAADAKLIDDLAGAASLVGLTDDATATPATLARRVAKLDAARTALSQRVAQLVVAARAGAEDTRRLDWLEQRAKQDESVTLGWSREDHDYDEWAGRSVVWPESFWAGDETAIDPPHPTLRPAIDAARASRPTERLQR